VDRGRAGQVEIHYNTNGTQWPQRGPDIWRHFRTVEVAFSIDDVGERFEYQRTNARWPDVNHNLHQFRDLRSQHPNIQLQCCSTVNVFNVMYLEELADWIDDQAFDFVYWNMLHEAQYLSVASMPLAAKRIAQEKLKQAQVSPRHRAEFDRIIDFIQNGHSLDGHDLVRRIGELDQIRHSDLRNHHSDLAEAIGYAGP